LLHDREPGLAVLVIVHETRSSLLTVRLAAPSVLCPTLEE